MQATMIHGPSHKPTLDPKRVKIEADPAADADDVKQDDLSPGWLLSWKPKKRDGDKVARRESSPPGRTGLGLG